jgi:hypothetical protein
MKTRSLLIGVAMAAVLNGAAVNAQVLGGVGGVGGGLGGTLSGGLRDMNMTSHGTMNGSLGGDLDTSTLRRTTRDTTERVTNRARGTTGAVRDRAGAKVDETRGKVASIKDVQIEGAADAAGAATSSASRDGLNLAGTGQGAASGAVSGASLPQAELPNVAPNQLASNETLPVTNAAQRANEPVKNAAAEQPASSGSGLLDMPRATEPATASAPAASPESARGLNIDGSANGSASASRSGVSAAGDGSANASRK